MLDKNKKFRVIEEGVMNQGEMGMTKGGAGGCLKYGPCKDIPVLYNVCIGYSKFCPDVEVYLICPGQNTYFNYCCPSILPE